MFFPDADLRTRGLLTFCTIVSVVGLTFGILAAAMYLVFRITSGPVHDLIMGGFSISIAVGNSIMIPILIGLFLREARKAPPESEAKSRTTMTIEGDDR